MMKLFIFMSLTITLGSCGSFVDKVHQQISAGENGTDNLADKNNPYPSQAYGKLKSKYKDKMPIKDPITFTLSGEEKGVEMDQTPLKVKRRFTTSDFIDSDATGSLWSNYDDSTSLFSTSNSRKSGDIVVIDVLETMKNSISKELRKTFPLIPLFQSNPIVSTLEEGASDDEKKTGDDGRSPASATAKKDEVKEDTEVADIVYDKISSRVSSEVSKEYVLLKGRKEVYFRNQKRLIEIHGLAKKSDIDSGDRIKSDQLIESKIFVIQ